MLPIGKVADAHGVDMAIKGDNLFTVAHPAERIALWIDLRLIKAERFHFFYGAADHALFPAAFARDADEVAQEFCHLRKIPFRSFLDFIEIHGVCHPFCQ